MKRNKWTPEQIAKLRELYPCWSRQKVAEMLGVTAMAVKTQARKLGLCKRRVWTDDEIKYVKDNYANTPTQQIAAHINRTITAVFGLVSRLGLEKSEAFRNSPLSGRLRPGSNIGGNTRFKKGIVPVTKGKKQHEYMSAEAIERTKATRFKKGNQPHNIKRDQEIVIRTNYKRNIKSVWVRIEKGKWRELHRVLWEQTMGPIPKGINIQFKDRNPLNTHPSNLYMIDRHNQMRQNTIHRYTPEVKELIRLVSKLKRKIKSHEEQD